MTIFRPCIDLHEGHVKQIVGSTLSDGSNRLAEVEQLIVNLFRNGPRRGMRQNIKLMICMVAM